MSGTLKKILFLMGCLSFVSFPIWGIAQEANLLNGLSIKALKGQSEPQKKKDSLACAELTQEQMEKMQNEGQGNSGQKKSADAGRGVARGAAGGALRGEIIDGDPGRGAMVGAVGGGVRAGLRHKMMEKKEKEAKEKVAKQAFVLAFSTCMQEKGYEVIQGP